jgi:hypothetical protein
LIRRVRIAGIKNELNRVIRSADGIYVAMLPYVDFSYEAIRENPVHPLQATKIIELSFMNIISAWEEFVQAVFIRYMIGGTSDSGYAPALRIGKCRNLSHTLELISGKDGFDPSTDYLDWSDWPKVIHRARIFFEHAEPFSFLTDNQKQLLKDSVVIRNRVAHSSNKCKQAFTVLAKRYLGLKGTESLPKGFTVGRLLIADKVRGFNKEYRSENYYQSFSVMFRKLADLIAP